MDIITDTQWADWRLDPVTQTFLKYILLKKQEIGRQKLEMLGFPASQLDLHSISLLNGMEAVCNGILQLKLPEMTQEIHSLEEEQKEYRQMLKETTGVEL